METAVGDDKVGRFFLHQPCYHFRCQTSSVNGTLHMSVSVADLLWSCTTRTQPSAREQANTFSKDNNVVLE